MELQFKAPVSYSLEETIKPTKDVVLLKSVSTQKWMTLSNYNDKIKAKQDPFNGDNHFKFYVTAYGENAIPTTSSVVINDEVVLEATPNNRIIIKGNIESIESRIDFIENLRDNVDTKDEYHKLIIGGTCEIAEYFLIHYYDISATRCPIDNPNQTALPLD